MDRTEGSNFIDIGAGRRGFQDQNAEAGVPGTRVTASYLNAIQEEIMAVIENAGLTADKANWQQLDAAIRKLAAKIVNDYNIPLAQLNCLPWLPIISLTQKNPPAKPATGEMYIVPDGGNGEWSDKAGQIAEWNGSKWLFSNARDGHGIGLPDGQILQKVNGSYVPQIASDVQSGKWLYAEAGGTANALTATLNPKPVVLFPGIEIRLKITLTNTANPTLNLNGLGTYAINNVNGKPIEAGGLQPSTIAVLIFDGNSFVCTNAVATKPWVNDQIVARSPMLMKQGVVTVPPTGKTVASISVTFDTAFPTACTGISITPNDYVNTEGWVGTPWAKPINRAKFNLYIDTNGTKTIDRWVPCAYIAIGY